ncbi:glycogen debranching N-terminal domain-containing protein [Arthrobacter sp. NA-172]|uniref:glycogen debranching N-terminal domain-containing protein n=1 Tax=Arthrobacter sp. NA-172 TaxID=3367524 RepID=UPI0037543D3D
MSHQPYLHNLSGVFAAPIQAWADAAGQIRGTGAQGVYCSDARVISEAVVLVDGVEPEWVSTQTTGAHRVSYVSFLRANADIADPLVSFTRTRSAAAPGITESFEILSALDEPREFTVQLNLAADNSPVETIKRGDRSQTPVEASLDGWQWRDEDTSLLLSHTGSPDVVADGSTVTMIWTVEVQANGKAEFGWTATAYDGAAPMAAPATPPLATPSVTPMAAPAAPAAEQARVARLLHRAVSDLNGLRIADRQSPDDTFLAAGAPWFFTMFGRDSLIAARMLLPIDTTLAAGTLRALAKRQGTRTDLRTAEQPGKILHEVRRSETTFNLDGSLSLPPVYFGTIDATPLWIILLHDAWQAGMPESEVRELMPHLERALVWLRDHGDSDGDGFLEYLDTSGQGLANQGWKDSGDSIRHHNGELAEGPIALCEVQGYAYAAALAGAALLETFGHGDGSPGGTPEEWRNYAHAMAERFRAGFWCADADGPYPALALDADKKPVDAVASNMGHLLGTGILNAEETAAVVKRLMGPTMFSGYGIRTISTTNGAYWPTRYHAGSVWTHDTAMILSGLMADGYDAEARTLAVGLLTAAENLDWRLPELFSGLGIEEASPPIPYPASCRPQAWAAASAVPIAQALGQLLN